MKRKTYHHPEVTCPKCGEETTTSIRDDSFSYDGPCGTKTQHYPLYLATDCCDEALEIELEEDFEDMDDGYNYYERY